MAMMPRGNAAITKDKKKSKEKALITNDKIQRKCFDH